MLVRDKIVIADRGGLAWKDSSATAQGLPFSSERLDSLGEKLRYTLPIPTVEGQMVLLLKPSELLDKLA